MEYLEIEGIGIFRSELLSESGFIHGFTTRKIEGIDRPSISPASDDTGGESFNKLLTALNLQDCKPVFQHQVHGDSVTTIAKDQLSGEITVLPENDGLVAVEPGICLFSHSADCMNLIIAHPESGAVGIAHCGRKGTLLNLPVKMVVTLCQTLTILPSELIAAMGSCICAKCYEVGQDVVDEIGEIDPTAFGFLYRRESRRFFDIRGYVYYQLTFAGVDPRRIDVQTLCTHCNPDLFYSYRRDGKARGYQAGFIASGIRNVKL
jgi:YfiH family protein